MTLSEIQAAKVNGTHPDGWFWSARLRCVTRPKEWGPYSPSAVPGYGWEIAPPDDKPHLKPWKAAP